VAEVEATALAAAVQSLEAASHMLASCVFSCYEQNVTSTYR
jgi:hypothetical protein